MLRRCITAWVVVVGLLVVSGADAGELLDRGTLDPAWFGPDVEFRTTKDIDYLWVKEGFSLQGRTLHIQPWADPEFLAERGRRSPRDAAKAGELTELMPGRLRGALSVTLSGIAEVSRERGDILVTGRLVDCKAGSRTAKVMVGMGAGTATATWDMKFTDAETGELLVAIHHRAASRSSMTEIDDRIHKWLEEFAEAAKSDFADFQRGKPATR